jgi:sporulation protein YlmC with PRC-barrel domain
MLLLSTSHYNRDILSLRTGSVIGHAERPIINPDNLKIEGWFATNLGRKRVILPSIEIRDFITKGIVVNDHDALTDYDDMVRLKQVIAIGYELLGKPVYTENKRRVGKVVDFATDKDSLYIQSLYINQSLLRGFTTQQLIIGRDDIVEITPKHVVIKDVYRKSSVTQTSPQAVPSQ